MVVFVIKCTTTWLGILCSNTNTNTRAGYCIPTGFIIKCIPTLGQGNCALTAISIPTLDQGYCITTTSTTHRRKSAQAVSPLSCKLRRSHPCHLVTYQHYCYCYRCCYFVIVQDFGIDHRSIAVAELSNRNRGLLKYLFLQLLLTYNMPQAPLDRVMSRQEISCILGIQQPAAYHASC